MLVRVLLGLRESCRSETSLVAKCKSSLLTLGPYGAPRRTALVISTRLILSRVNPIDAPRRRERWIASAVTCYYGVRVRVEWTELCLSENPTSVSGSRLGF